MAIIKKRKQDELNDRGLAMQNYLEPKISEISTDIIVILRQFIILTDRK